MYCSFFQALPERIVCVCGKLLHLGGEGFSKVFSYFEFDYILLEKKNLSTAKFLVRGERATAARHSDCFRRFQ